MTPVRPCRSIERPSTSVIGSLGWRGRVGRLVGRSVPGPAVLRPVGTGTGSMPRSLRTWFISARNAPASSGRPAGSRRVVRATSSSTGQGSPGTSADGAGTSWCDVLVGDGQGRVAAERRMPGEHLVQHDAGGVDVAAGVGAAALELLGGQVGDGADEDAAGLAGLPGADDGPRQPEVGDLDDAVDADQHVLGLDVAVHDAGPVGGGEAGQRGLEDGEGLGDGQPAAGGEQVAQRAAADELHDEEDQALVAALVADRRRRWGG